MKICRTQLSSEPRRCKAYLNFAINPDTIPTLITAEKLKELTKGDESPYFVVEEILDIREPVKGVEFTREFWESFLGKLNDAPLPGSKSGHTSPYEWWVTGDMDFFTVGGDIKGNSVFLKMYIPSQGYKSSNEIFIKALKTGVVHFSIVSWTEDLIEVNEAGEIVSIKAIRSVKGERNDAAERNMGAMEQRVNRDNPDQNKSSKEMKMSDITYEKIITNLKTRCAVDNLDYSKVAKDLGFSILTDKDKVKIDTLSEIKKITGENPVEKIKAMKAKEEIVSQQAYDNLREKLMSENFGPEKIHENGQEKLNLKRSAADPHVSKEIQTEEQLKQEIEKAKEDPVVESISFQAADVNSSINNLSGVKVNTAATPGYRNEVIKI